MGVVRSPLASRLAAVRDAFADLVSQEFGWSAGHLATIANGCVFAPSIFTFWLVNGVLDFSTAVLIGSIASPGGLVVRLVAYLLLVPTFLLLRASYYLAHPVHRRTILQGACPQSQLLSLDWFSVGILTTGLPLALQDLGPWLGMNAVFLLGLFVVPRFLPDRRATRVKFGTIGLGSGVFLYANYGGLIVDAVPGLPAPGAVLGPVATLQLSAGTTDALLGMMNALATAPIAVALVAVVMNRLLTRPELTSVPVVRKTLPRRDPTRLVAVSSALGTVFYLAVVALWTGRLIVVP